jgi:adenosylcobyric acid synthase
MAKAIMIQGTMSNVGKSLLVAGLCRVFRQDGYRVAPFKSQNMALNSFITKEGKEMGRAQVVQCEAAKIEPSVRMNPILLKPTNDIGSQVIVKGEPIGVMKAKEYFQFKKKLIPVIQECYDSLDKEYDIIVLEGAGSPAEINLKQEDIVNMGMAKMAKAPVLLVGDIDRGGVFAQLLGTLLLLEEEEKKRIKGLLVNKFRGDKTILEPGLRMLEQKGNKPVLGAIPYLSVDIEEEDSLTERFDTRHGQGLLDIAVIRFPRISNYTDFAVLEARKEITLRYVSTPKELGNPDMILLPGSKNTMEDLLWMRQNGLETLLHKEMAKGTILFGICGGYQMMGETLHDPYAVEHGGSLKGMGIFPMDTIFQKEKITTQVSGKFQEMKGSLASLSHKNIEGYEIHMGVSTAHKDSPMTQITADGMAFKTEGFQKGNCYGTYIHGIFDHQEVSLALVADLLQKKGLSQKAVEEFSWKDYKDKQYDLLADALREHLDMEKIYEILWKGEG